MTYILEAEAAAWLYPLLEIAGLLCQLISLLRKSLILLFGGLALTLTAAAMEQDITLAAADLLAAAGFYILFFYKK